MGLLARQAICRRSTRIGARPWRSDRQADRVSDWGPFFERSDARIAFLLRIREPNCNRFNTKVVKKTKTRSFLELPLYAPAAIQTSIADLSEFRVQREMQFGVGTGIIIGLGMNRIFPW